MKYTVPNKKLMQRHGVSLKQACVGRLRVRVKRLRRNERSAQQIQNYISAQEGIIKVETRRATGSVIVHFAATLRVGEVLGLLIAGIDEIGLNRGARKSFFSLPTAQETAQSNEGCKSCATCEECAHISKQDFLTKKRRVLFFSAFMLYSLARLWIFHLPLIQTPFSLLGIATMIGTIPLIKEAVNDTVEKKKITVKPFLALGSIATLVLGEAFSALQILWIYNVAELTEDYVAGRSRQAIRNILQVAPAVAYILVDGTEIEIAVADIQPGDIVVAHTGEKIAVDGLVEKGEALVDEATINGRSENIAHVPGDTVFAGTIVTQGCLHIRTVKTGEETYLASIMKMVEESMGNKAPVEQKADELAGRLLKLGLVATALTFAITLDPLRALTVMLVMSCPCATVLAASSAVTASLANAARYSILIKGGLYLEMVGRADVYCLDKTGTLTSEEPEVIAVCGRTPSLDEEKILSLAATAESHNQHPMAKAIVAEAKKREITINSDAVCEFKPGRGVTCTMESNDAVTLVGNYRFMQENDIDVSWFNKRATEQKRAGNTVVYVASGGKVKGIIAVANPIRRETPQMLQRLRDDGVRQIHLISGDTGDVARTMQQVFDFDDIQGDLLPEEKAAHILKMQEKSSVVMVGDGVNDALAMAEADIGIAMGAAGAEVALEAADIALADSNLDGLMVLRELSQKTMRVVDQNHWFAVSTDLLGAALGMVGILSPIMAGAIHIIHTGGILINSSLLLKWQPPTHRNATRIISTESEKNEE